MDELLSFVNDLIIENQDNYNKFMSEYTSPEVASRISRGRSEDLRWQLNELTQLLNHNVASLK